MFRAIVTFIAVIAATLTIADSDKLAAQWKSRYEEISRVVRAKNLPKFESYIAAEYIWVLADGETKKRAEALLEFTPLFEMKKIVGGEKIVGVTKRGDVIEVTFESNWTFTGKDNKIIRSHEIGIDSWKKFEGKWLIVRTQDKAPGN